MMTVALALFLREWETSLAATDRRLVLPMNSSASGTLTALQYYAGVNWSASTPSEDTFLVATNSTTSGQPLQVLVGVAAFSSALAGLNSSPLIARWLSRSPLLHRYISLSLIDLGRREVTSSLARFFVCRDIILPCTFYHL